jgi:hypothetical protein
MVTGDYRSQEGYQERFDLKKGKEVYAYEQCRNLTILDGYP